MNDFKFVSDKYDIKYTSEYRLSIQLDRDGFSVLICDSDKNVLKIQHIHTGSQEKTIEIFKNDLELDHLKRLRYQYFDIVLNSSEFNLIPNELVNNDNERFLLSHSISLAENDSIVQIPIDSFETTALIKIDTLTYSFINLFKNSPEISHISNPFLNYCHRKSTHKEVFIYSAGNVLHICKLDQNKLVFYNSFACNSITDQIYHILNVSEKINKESEICKLFYFGEAGYTSDDFKLLCHYIPGLEQLPNEFEFGLAGELNENYFSNLLEHLHCVL